MTLPFPRIESAIDNQCSEVLFETIAHYEDNQLEVEAGTVGHLSQLLFTLFLTPS